MSAEKHDCSQGCAQCLELARAGHQPFGIELFSADNVFVKQMVISKMGTFIPQHAHRYPHLTMVATGSLRAWRGDELLGDFKAPTGIEIPAGVKHTFQSLEDNTIAYCVHNLRGNKTVSILAEHQIVEAA